MLEKIPNDKHEAVASRVKNDTMLRCFDFFEGCDEYSRVDGDSVPFVLLPINERSLNV